MIMANPIAAVRRFFRRVRGLPTFHKEIDGERFVDATKVLLKRVEKILRRHWKRHFEVFQVTTTEGKLILELSPEQGYYAMTADEEKRCVHYRSPVSGRTPYYLNVDTNQFVSDVDGHDLEDKLGRDLTSQCPTLSTRR